MNKRRKMWIKKGERGVKEKEEKKRNKIGEKGVKDEE